MTARAAVGLPAHDQECGAVRTLASPGARQLEPAVVAAAPISVRA
jgi:hypothetical protein